MKYIEYLKYLKFVFSEELDRMHEFLYEIDHLDSIPPVDGEEGPEDKYYLAYPRSNCPPDFEACKEVWKHLNRDAKADMAIITSDDPAKKEELYEVLRDIMLEI